MGNIKFGAGGRGDVFCGSNHIRSLRHQVQGEK